MTNATDALRACPFCGHAPFLSLEGVAGDGITSPFHVRCLRCRIKLTRETRDEVVAAWNATPAGSASGVFGGMPLHEALACAKRYARESDKLRPRLAQTLESLALAVAALQAEVARLKSEVAILENNLAAQESCTAKVSEAFDERNDTCAVLTIRADSAEAALAEARRDAERLDYLDQLNAALNAYYGTSYGWELILSPNIVRLMSGAHTFGFVGDIDLNDAALGKRAHKSCRAAIDAALKESAPPVAPSLHTPPDGG